MENKEVIENKDIVVDYKDYVPPVLNEDPEFEEVILEDIKGTKFKCKFRKPSISESLKIERENTYIRLVDEGQGKTAQIKGLENEKIAQIIFDKFDCLPINLKVDILKKESVLKLVQSFLE